DVELGDADLVTLLGRYLFEDGRDHAAWTAPGRPEIHEHGPIRFQDLLLERLVGDDLRLTHLVRLLFALYHLNASCWPDCSTAGSRPRTGSRPSRPLCGSPIHRRNGSHFTNRQPRRRTTSASAGERRSFSCTSGVRSSATARKRNTRSPSGIASPRATMLRWMRAVQSTC